MKTAYFPAHYQLSDKLGWLALRAFPLLWHRYAMRKGNAPGAAGRPLRGGR